MSGSNGTGRPQGAGAANGDGAAATVPDPVSAQGGAGSTGRPRRRAEVVHRGVQWRRSVGGTITWLNEGLGRWVTWYPGSDAPPLPPGWGTEVGEDSGAEGGGGEGGRGEGGRGEGGGAEGSTSGGAAGPGVAGGRPRAGAGRRTAPATGSGDEPVERHRMRSPYRMAPVVIAVLIVAAAIWQATQSPVKATPADIAAARALKGQCLARSGGTFSQPKFSPTPVSCSSRSASVMVVAVVVPHSKDKPRNCPVGAGLVQVLQPGIMNEPVECTEPVKHPK